jgi:hypothetical protein
MSHQLSFDLPAARAAGVVAGEACADKATRVAAVDQARARSFVLTHLRRHGATSGEDLVDAMTAAGMRPHDARAFGPVFRGLAALDLIEHYGTADRRKGHGTNGARIWRVTRAGLAEAAT